MTNQQSDSEKLDEILRRLRAVEYTVNPPFWKVFLHWFFAHFFTLVLLLFISFVVWEVWSVVQSVLDATNSLELKFENFKDVLTEFKGSVFEKMENLKFWK